MSLGSRGDTIVEVLVALAVTSLLLGGAMATTSNSLTGARKSQERAEALKIAESQAESLRFLGATGVAAINDFCLDTTPAVMPIAGGIPASFGLYPPACKQQNLYYVVIDHGSTPTANVFDIIVRWERIGGGPNEEVKLRYSVF